eukprot:5625539-Amphidinium_carterae.2
MTTVREVHLHVSSCEVHVRLKVTISEMPSKVASLGNKYHVTCHPHTCGLGHAYLHSAEF